MNSLDINYFGTLIDTLKKANDIYSKCLQLRKLR